MRWSDITTVYCRCEGNLNVSAQTTKIGHGPNCNLSSKIKEIKILKNGCAECTTLPGHPLSVLKQPQHFWFLFSIPGLKIEGIPYYAAKLHVKNMFTNLIRALVTNTSVLFSSLLVLISYNVNSSAKSSEK